MVPYVVGAVVAMIVMHVLFFVVCVFAARLLGCEGEMQRWCGVRGRCGWGECVYGWYTWFMCFG